MRQKLSVLAIVLFCVTLLICVSTWAEEVPNIIASGDCGSRGSSITWTLDSEGVLIISGEGKMADYYSNSPAPWNDYRKKIKNIIIDNGVTSIGSCAFDKCSSLVELILPEGLTTISTCAFQSCSSLLTLTLPDSIISIGDSAFANCSSLTNIDFPNNLTSIEYAAFRGCSSLVSVTLPSSVTFIDYYAFPRPTTMVATVEKGSYAYRWCIANNVQFRVDVSLIAFGTCGVNLVWDIDTKGTLTISGTGDMHNYQSHSPSPWYLYNSTIKNLVIEKGVTSVGWRAFEDCSLIASVSFPNSLISIGHYTFSSCNSLTSINLPDNLTTIGPGAFYYCSSLASINLPDSVTSIGGDAFTGCRNLKYVLITGETRPTYTLYGAPSELTIYCYKSSEVVSWATENGYKVVFIDESNIPGDANNDSTINIDDAIAILQYCAGENVSISTNNANVNDDSVTDIHDALLLLQYCAGWNVTLK